LDNLFYIAHANAMDMMSIEEKKERFQITCAKIDQKLFNFGILNDYVATRINNKKNQIIEFCRCELKKEHVLYDYRELL